MAGRLPRVAVLLSTYNGARFLDEQLDSLLAQREVEVTLHARDDGSTDETLGVLARYADRWPCLANLTSGPNLGPAASFLELLRTAPNDADYYAFCDQDDVWLPEKLARAVAALAGEEGPALYCSNVTCVGEDLHVLGHPDTSTKTDFRSLLYENSVYGCTAVMNAAARGLVAGAPPSGGLIMHDWWSALVVSIGGVIRYDPKPGILYRQHSGNSVGGATTRTGRIASHLRQMRASRRGFYPVQAQAAELRRLHGHRMDDAAMRLVDRLVRSKSSASARLQLAASADVVRSKRLDGLAARLLIALNWH